MKIVPMINERNNPVANVQIVQLADGREFLIHYGTPLVYVEKRGVIVTNSKHSITSSRVINSYLKQIGYPVSMYAPQHLLDFRLGEV